MGFYKLNIYIQLKTSQNFLPAFLKVVLREYFKRANLFSFIQILFCFEMRVLIITQNCDKKNTREQIVFYELMYFLY